jgi:delta-aminolevulinic acid dehydratase/porphobilinogen synthase
LPDKGPDLLHWRRSHLSLPSQVVSKTNQDSNQRLLGSVRLQEESVRSRVSEYDTVTVRSLGPFGCAAAVYPESMGQTAQQAQQIVTRSRQATAAFYGLITIWTDSRRIRMKIRDLLRPQWVTISRFAYTCTVSIRLEQVKHNFCPAACCSPRSGRCARSRPAPGQPRERPIST